MKKVSITLTLIFFSCTSPSECPELIYDSLDRITYDTDGNLYTGRCITYEGNTKRSVQQYLGGNDYGVWTFYYPEGQIETKGRFNKDGKRVGTWKYFYNNGKLKQVSKYSKNGDRKGKWIEYNMEGEKVSEINY